MHPNPSFRKASDQQNLMLARERAFGILAVSADPSEACGPLISHIPFIVSDDGSVAEFHLVRSNPIAQQLKKPCAVTIAVTTCDGYISPDWYATQDMVPTWNYVAVHLRGRAELAPQDSLPDLLARQSKTYETRIQNKPPWSLQKLSAEAFDKMQRMIVPVRMQIETIDGTWKLGQNKDDAARHNAAEQLHTGFGENLPELAQLMRNPPA